MNRDELLQTLRRFFTGSDAEEATDALIDGILFRLRLPWWFPFKGMIRRRLDDFLPEGLFTALDHALRGADEGATTSPSEPEGA